MIVCQISVGIEMPRFPNPVPLGTDQDNIQPKLWLSSQRTAWHVVSFTRIRHHVFDGEILTRTMASAEEGTIDATPIFQHRLGIGSLDIDQLEIFDQNLAGIPTFFCKFQGAGK